MVSLTVEVGDGIRHDLKSNECRCTHPFLPTNPNWERSREYTNARMRHMAVRDTIAYNKIKSQFPDFRPPRLQVPTIHDRFLMLVESLLRRLRRQ